MKFKDFQAPVLFSSTFKALNLGKKIKVLSRTFKDAWEPWWKHLRELNRIGTNSQSQKCTLKL